MTTYLISIISEQPVPNYLFIKEFQQQVDKFIFISTQQMEQKNKTNIICETAEINKSNRIKTLIPDDALKQSIDKLSKLTLPNDAIFLVNLTGGTKMMSIAVWRFFSKFPNSRFFYVPIGRNVYNELFDEKPSTIHNFNYKLSVQEYLQIYGIRYEQEPQIFDEDLVFEIFNDVISGQFNIKNFPKNKFKYTIPNNKQYHTKWFEEFVYYKIKKQLNLDNNQIYTGIKLFDIKQEKNIDHYNNDNEVDVIFIYNNRPFIIECKFSLGEEKVNTTTLTQIIYKLSSINKRFGLSARATIFTFADLSTLASNAIDNLKRRCEIASIHYPLFDRSCIINDNFKDLLEAFIK
ncbi:MAG: DUF1887 family CARF protein [Bacteroidales bacterium]|nr:DUF1887 family CARF protein [Bacteroidales bacterium]